MTEALITTWNEQVGDDDLVIHLGDVTFSKDYDVLSLLNGKKILVLGNHDPNPKALGEYFSEGTYDYLTIRRGKRDFVLSHYPIESWDGKYWGTAHLHGHSHGLMDNSGLLRFDMGVDCWDYKLVDLDVFSGIIKEKSKEISNQPSQPSQKPARDTEFQKLYERALREEVEEGKKT